MKRITISLRNDTADDLRKLSEGIGCSRSALVEVLLSDSGMKHLIARLAYQNQHAAPRDGAMRYSGESVQEIEEAIERLKHNYQGELWDVAD